MRGPRATQVVTFRQPDEHGRQVGGVGYIQQLSNGFLADFGTPSTGRFASWARRTVDGVEVCTPMMFATYDREKDAIAHAKYAAAKVRDLTLAEMIKAEAARDAKRNRGGKATRRAS